MLQKNKRKRLSDTVAAMQELDPDAAENVEEWLQEIGF